MVISGSSNGIFGVVRSMRAALRRVPQQRIYVVIRAVGQARRDRLKKKDHLRQKTVCRAYP